MLISLLRRFARKNCQQCVCTGLLGICLFFVLYLHKIVMGRSSLDEYIFIFLLAGAKAIIRNRFGESYSYIKKDTGCCKWIQLLTFTTCWIVKANRYRWLSSPSCYQRAIQACGFSNFESPGREPGFLTATSIMDCKILIVSWLCRVPICFLFKHRAACCYLPC